MGSYDHDGMRKFPPGKFFDDQGRPFIILMSGRFVGDQNGRIDRQRARNGDALLLAAGHLGRIVRQALAKPDAAKHVAGAIERVIAAGQFQRHGNIFKRRHCRHQVKALKDKSDPVAAKGRQGILIQAVIILPGNDDASGIDAFKARDNHQQCRFSRSGRPDKADAFSLRNGKVHLVQDMNPRRSRPKREVDILQKNSMFVHGTGPIWFGCPDRRDMGFKLGQSKASSMIRLVLTVFVIANSLLFVPAFTPTNPAAAGETLRIVVLGDSLTAGYGLPPGKGFPAQLQQVLAARGHAVEVVDAGVSGDTSRGGLARLEWSVPADADAVIVELGANDALRGIDPAVTRQSLEEIVVRLKARKQAVILAGMLAPPNMGDDYGGRFNPIYPEIAEKHGVRLYPFFLDGIAGNARLNLADGIHPTEEGIAIIVEKILPLVEAMVEALQSQ